MATSTSGAGESSRGTVRFVLDEQVVEVANVDPTRTVLEFLREDCGRTGSKEGCAEGDCGACTVVLGQLDGAGVRFRAVNACIQFLPTLDGKELITVENLRRADGALHPVQQAMVDLHGSQCGFCTPGFVMALFALYHRADRRAVDRQRVNDWIAGNLCRCTGYRPIVDAALSACALPPDDWFSAGESEARRTLGELRDSEDVFIGTRERFFAAPASITALARLYFSHPDAT